MLRRAIAARPTPIRRPRSTRPRRGRPIGPAARSDRPDDATWPSSTTRRDAGQGEIDIQTLTGTDAAGRPVRKVVVYLPGADNWIRAGAGDVNDLTTNRARDPRATSSAYETACSRR